jgi:hypothetical protein
MVTDFSSTELNKDLIVNRRPTRLRQEKLAQIRNCEMSELTKNNEIAIDSAECKQAQSATTQQSKS